MAYELLNDKEKNAFWKFISCFSKPLFEMINTHDDNEIVFYHWNNQNFDVQMYREYIIQTINKNYTIEEFYIYEMILNKLYWHLKRKVREFFSEQDRKSKYLKLDKDEIMHNTPKLNHYDGQVSSLTNSHLQFNESKSKYYYMNELSLMDKKLMEIMTNRIHFEFYYNNPNMLPQYKIKYIMYHYLNYAFPNTNPMFDNENSKEYKMKKIEKLYYSKENNWYKIIHS